MNVIFNLYHVLKIPRSGYIDVRDYETPESLATYLNRLSKDRNAYNAYFNWKQHVVFKKRMRFSPLCNICVF